MVAKLSITNFYCNNYRSLICRALYAAFMLATDKYDI